MSDGFKGNCWAKSIAAQAVFSEALAHIRGWTIPSTLQLPTN
jgi:hypothetical protein